MKGPSRVRLTRHAQQRMEPAGVTVDQVADAVLEHHHRRKHTPRAADWAVRVGLLEVIYNWPDRGDETTALVVTIVRER